MRRLGIFSFYDKEGIVDSYIEYLIEDLILLLDKLIIVVNGKLNKEGKTIFEKYTKQVIIRSNTGFDAGAYSDVIVNILGEEEIKNWDELVLCNDTFYGPFVSFCDIFDHMNHCSTDFWGLNYIENHLWNHIQSYFIVYRSRVLQSGKFFKYIKKNININETEITNIYAFFEVGLFQYLVNCGFRFSVYAGTQNYGVYDSADICIEKYNFPVLKKKTFAPKYFDYERQVYTLQNIELNTNYDIKHILSNAERQYGFYMSYEQVMSYERKKLENIGKREPVAKITPNDLKYFIQINSRIYIYGTGVVARTIWFLYCRDVTSFCGFVVSDDQQINMTDLFGFPVLQYHCLEGDEAVIIALNPENTNEVRVHLRESCNVFFLWKNE